MTVKPSLDPHLPASMQDPLIDKTNVVLTLQDRALPWWALGISSVFTISSSLCWIAAAVTALFFQANVAEQGNAYLAPILGLVAAMPVLALLVLDFAHNKALAGFRYTRMGNETRVRALVAGLIIVAMALVHPLLAVGLLAGAALVFAMAKVFLRLQAKEPMWDFTPAEAVSLLSGRDAFGLYLARRNRPDLSVFSTYQSIASAAVLVATLASASWLAAEAVISTAAVLPVVLLAFWSQGAIGAYVGRRLIGDTARHKQQSDRVEKLVPTAESESVAPRGLAVSQLSVTSETGTLPLRDIEFSVDPGMIVGVIGSVGSGKTILLQCIASPFDLANLTVRGSVTFNQTDLWERHRSPQPMTVVHCPAQPLLLHADGTQNITCFHSHFSLDRLRKPLEQMVFSADSAERILQVADVQNLSGSEQKALSFARAFLLNPELYLFDRPEDLASDGLLSALSERIKVEARAGRSFLLATQDRRLLDQCDMLLVLESGRLIDFGPAAEIRVRMENGWSRLVTENELESEDALHLWIRSHFRRAGDEGNRRKTCLVASELLAMAAQAVSGALREKIHFDFKHFQGHCCLEMTDSGPAISNAQLEKAQQIITGDKARNRQAPLAEILRHTLSFEQRNGPDKRVLSVKIETYDPRKSLAGKAGKNADRF